MEQNQNKREENALRTRRLYGRQHVNTAARAEAAIVAAMNADRLAKKGDRTGQALWLRVIEAVKVLEVKAPAAGVAVQ